MSIRIITTPNGLFTTIFVSFALTAISYMVSIYSLKTRYQVRILELEHDLEQEVEKRIAASK